MADADGNRIGNWWCHVAAWVVGENDTTATIRVESRFYSDPWGYNVPNFNTARCYCDGQDTGYGAVGGVYAGTGVAARLTMRSQDFTVAKHDNARNVWCVAGFHLGGYQVGTSEAGVNVAIGGINYKTPRPPLNVKWTRVDDTAVNNTWTSNWDAGYPQPWKQIVLDRAEGYDGGGMAAWHMVATLGWDATNYRYTGLRANAKYQFRVLARNQVGDSNHVTSGYIYTTPAAPKSLDAAKTGAGEVTLTADVSNSYAWSVDFERSADNGATWDAIDTGRTVSNGKVTYVDEAAPAGTVRYRARSWRFIYGDGGDGLFSAYTTSNNVTTITPPLAPKITSPTAGGAFDVAEPITVSWLPNHPDASAQTLAEVETVAAADDAVTHTVTGSATTLKVDAGGRTGTWKARVRTKGLHADWGAWSDWVTFIVAARPNVVVTAPSGDITESPFDVAWSVQDTTGVSMQLVEIVLAGEVKHSETVPVSANRITVTAGEYLPENGTQVGIRVTIRGGSTLTTTVTVLRQVAYTPPANPIVETRIDAATLAATYVVRAGETTGDQPPTDHILLRRIIDDDMLLLASNLTDGQQTIDRLPPLRYEYTVEAVAMAASGASAVTRVAVSIDTDMCCLNFGADAGETLPVGGAFTVNEKPALATEEYHFASGDADGLPSSYMMRDLDSTLSLSSSYDWDDGEPYRRIRRLARAHAYAWFRNMDGSRMRVRVSMTQKLAANGLTVDFDADMTELAWKEPER